MSKSIPEWQDTISTWADSTFDHTEVGIVKHLLREAVELASTRLTRAQIRQQVEVALGRVWADGTTDGAVKNLDEEAADVLILDLALAGYLGFSLEDALIQKHSINLLREWGKPDAEGVTEHVRNA